MIVNQKKRGKSRQGKRKNDGFDPLARASFNPLNDGQSYANQQGVVLRVPAAPILNNVSIAGATSVATQISKNLVGAFNTRFATTFNQYRILGADIEMIPLTTTFGSSVFFWDEKSTTAPVAADATERVVVAKSNSNASLAGKSYHMTWRAKDLLDLGYLETTAAAVTVCTFKSYTDLANYGTPAAGVNNVWLLKPMLLIEFRGIIAV